MTTTQTLRDEYREFRPSTPIETRRDEALADMFTTALEGGIGYWSTCLVYRWSLGAPENKQARDFVAVIEDHEEDDAPQYLIDRAVMVRGARLLHSYLNALENANRYHLAAMNDFRFGRWDDLDFDADTADMVVQMGLFGKLVYG